MPLIGERQKYYRELAALHNEVRRKPLERSHTACLDIILSLCGIVCLILVFVVIVLIILYPGF